MKRRALTAALRREPQSVVRLWWHRSYENSARTPFGAGLTRTSGGLGRAETAVDLVPVDDVPERRDVVGTTVLVVQVVRVLPSRPRIGVLPSRMVASWRGRRTAICRRPPRAMPSRCRSGYAGVGERHLEAVEVTEGGGDGVRHRPRGLATATGRGSSRRGRGCSGPGVVAHGVRLSSGSLSRFVRPPRRTRSQTRYRREPRWPCRCSLWCFV